MHEKDLIRSKRYASQLIVFDGMQYGTISPTDIDGALEFYDKLFVFIEAKHGYTELPTGQKLLMERMVKRIRKGGAEAFAIQCMHYQSGDIKLKECRVLRFFDGEIWHELNKHITVGKTIERLRKKYL